MITELKETRYSVNQVASACEVHSATVWRWIQRGVRGRKLASFRIGGRTYVTATALQQFMEPPEESERENNSSTAATEAGRELDSLGI